MLSFISVLARHFVKVLCDAVSLWCVRRGCASFIVSGVVRVVCRSLRDCDAVTMHKDKSSEVGIQVQETVSEWLKRCKTLCLSG